MKEQKERAFFQILTFSVEPSTKKQGANQCPERYNKLDKKVLSIGNFSFQEVGHV
jgi:hypothetical protein